jgi:hypothetical protein
MTDAFVLGGVRTPVGRYGGSLSHIRTDDRPGTLSHKASSERPRPARGRGVPERLSTTKSHRPANARRR